MTEKLHLLKRGEVWWFQVAIPRSQHGHPAWEGKKIVSISLRTGDLPTARAERNKLMGEFQRKVDRIKSGGMSATDIAAEGERAKAELLAAILQPPSAEEMRQQQEWAELTAGLYDDMTAGLEAEVTEDIVAISERMGVPIEPGTALERTLRVAIHNAKRGALREQMATQMAPLKDALWPSTAPSPPPAAQAVEPETPPDETISTAADIYIDELRHKKKNLGPDAIALRRKVARLFVSYTGDATVNSITIAQAKDFMNRIARFSPTWRGDTFAEIEKQHAGGEQRLSVLTTNTYVAVLKAMLRSAMRRGTYRGPLNPFDDLHQAGAEAESYVAFEIDELNKLFADTKLRTKPKHHDNQTALPWLALLGLYTGARIEELAQLSVADVRQEHGTAVLDIHAKNGNRLKSKSSERLVPIHSAIINAGFLHYVAALPKSGRLFPGLKGRASRGGKLGTNVAESFGRWRKRVGLTRKGLAFHSLRHNTTQALERAGVEESDVARVLGHRLKNISFRVYSKPQLERVAKTVESIEYPGLKLPAAR
jgi:integrase